MGPGPRPRLKPRHGEVYVHFFLAAIALVRAGRDGRVSTEVIGCLKRGARLIGVPARSGPGVRGGIPGEAFRSFAIKGGEGGGASDRVTNTARTYSATMVTVPLAALATWMTGRVKMLKVRGSV